MNVQRAQPGSFDVSLESDYRTTSCICVSLNRRGWMVRVEERLDAQSAQIGQLLELVAARLPPAAGS